MDIKTTTSSFVRFRKNDLQGTINYILCSEEIMIPLTISTKLPHHRITTTDCAK